MNNVLDVVSKTHALRVEVAMRARARLAWNNHERNEFESRLRPMFSPGFSPYREGSGGRDTLT